MRWVRLAPGLGQAIEDIRAEVDPVRPDDRARLWMELDLAEKLGVSQANEDPAASKNPVLKSISFLKPSVNPSLKR